MGCKVIDMSLLQSIVRRVKKIKIPSQLLPILVIIWCIILVSGFLFCVINWESVSFVSAQAAAAGRTFAFELGLSPLSAQTFYEAFFLAIMFTLTFLGLLIVHDSASKPRDEKSALIVSLIGLLLLLAGLTGFWWIALRVFVS
ncbi:MAG: hypothetical protein DRJ98_00725 [Thermoprotei archaeon]|nr:MAG: hypothetical protein DRJ98_00725 [Thermoprotei archaeon]RLF18571.1 MAG: hypothetical protein DRN06_01095 [Thermoprotei archaeon]